MTSRRRLQRAKTCRLVSKMTRVPLGCQLSTREEGPWTGQFGGGSAQEGPGLGTLGQRSRATKAAVLKGRWEGAQISALGTGASNCLPL